MRVGEVAGELVVITADLGEGVVEAGGGDDGGVEVKETVQVNVEIVEVSRVEQCQGYEGRVSQEREEVVEAVSGGEKTTGQQLVELVLKVSPPLHISPIKVLPPYLTPDREELREDLPAVRVAPVDGEGQQAQADTGQQ